MSTRSVCAVPTEGGFRGRYVHSDGYPSHMVPTYLTLVARDGLDVVLKKITEDRYGWSSLDPKQPDITGIAPSGKPWYELTYGTPEHYVAMFAKDGMYGDGRFANEPGYGIAYTTETGGGPHPQSSPEEWVESDGDDWGTEWAYVLHLDGVEVWERLHERYSSRWSQVEAPDARAFVHTNKRGERSAWLYRGVVPWGATDYPDFEGEDDE